MHLIIGSNGQVGTELMKMYHGSAIGLTHSEIAIEDPESVAEVFEELKPSIVFNTAAMHVLSKCEEDPAQSFAVNAIGARNVANACAEYGAKLIHFSTDYVFRGDRTYNSEIDATWPVNVYGSSKLAGEHFVSQTNALIVRVSALFGKHKCRAKALNFPQVILKNAQENGFVRVVDNQFITPTYTHDLVRQVDKLIKHGIHGIVHCAATSRVSWYEYAKMILKAAGLSTDVIPVKASPDGIERPMSSALTCTTLNQLNLYSMRTLDDALRHYFDSGKH